MDTPGPHDPVDDAARIERSAAAFAPTARRRRGTLRLVAGAAAVAFAVSGSARAQTLTGFERALTGEINEFRAAHGLKPLRRSRLLTRAANAHDTEMSRFGFFSHESRDGTPFWARVERWYAPRRRTWAVGENILAASPTITPGATLRDWLNSPEHRDNLLNPAWREVGIAVVHVTSAPGAYANRPTTFVTADFGVRG